MKIHSIRFLLASLLLPILLFSAMGTLVAASVAKRKVVMVVIPAVSLNELSSESLKGFRTVMSTGAVGLMNARTGGRLDSQSRMSNETIYTPESGYVTMGSGTRAVAGAIAGRAFNVREKVDGDWASTLYRGLTMIDPMRSEIVHPGIAGLRRDSKSEEYRVTIGLLGKLLHSRGLKTAVLGNSDDNTLHREAVTICMDDKGLVDFGSVDMRLWMPKSEPPASAITKLKEVLRCIDAADLTVMELGDTASLDRSRQRMPYAAYRQQHAKAIQYADGILRTLLSVLDLRDTTLIVLSPYPSMEEATKHANRLCPVLIVGNGFGHGLLSSGSTRAAGVITNLDILPSILEQFGIPVPADLAGRPVSVVSDTAPVEKLQKLHERVMQQSLNQPAVRQSAVGVIILVGIITLLWLFLPEDHRLRQRVLPYAVLVPTVLAPSILLAALRPEGGLLSTWIKLMLAGAVLMVVALGIGRKPVNALMLVCLVLSGTIAGDVLTGGPLSRFSVMNYSIMDGSRFYGLGNEYMGALIGSSLVGIGLLLYTLNAGVMATRVVLALGLLVEAAVVGAPSVGANVGGAISVVAAFGLALAATSQKPFHPKKIVGVILGMVLVVGILAFIDSLRGPEHQSHLGRVVGLVMSGGLGEFATLVKRKLEMNLTLIRITAWGWLLASYLVSAVVALRAGNAVARLRPLPLHLRVILAGALGGALAALVFNDSGIVAAATSFVYTWALILLLALFRD